MPTRMHDDAVYSNADDHEFEIAAHNNSERTKEWMRGRNGGREGESEREREREGGIDQSLKCGIKSE